MLPRLICVMLVLLAMPLQSAEQLIKTTTSWDGGEIAYPEGEAEITAIRLIAKEGEWAPFHCHPVPTMGYVLSGTVKVQLLNGKESTFGPGDTVVEVMRTIHRGQGVGGDAELLVFYAGARDLPVSFTHGEEDAKAHCKE